MEKKRIKTPIAKKTKPSVIKKTGKESLVMAKQSKSSLGAKGLALKKSSSSASIKITDDYFKKKSVHSPFNFLGFLNDFAQALVIAAIIILLTISFIIVGGQKRAEELRVASGQKYFDSLSGVQIVKKDKGFFGSLEFSSNGQSDSFDVRQEEKVLGMGGMSGAYPGTGLVENDIMVDSKDMSMIYPMEIFEYNYIYVGEDFNLLPEEVNVYRRNEVDLSSQFTDLFSGKRVSFLDFKKFRNISINNLTINEDRDYGYSIHLGLKDGNFSLYKNWEKWPSIDKLCRGYDYGCYESYRLTINDFLSDEEIINITDNFLKEYGIPLGNYGSGEVQKYWMRDYVLSQDKASFYLPDSISVVYPLKIEGAEVYEDSGEKTGLMVEVDMREKRVSGVYNLFHQYYESSSYSTERDRASILKIVKNGGLYPWNAYYRDSVSVKTIDVQIGTPSIGIFRTWQYDESAMKGYEIYVPAYIFPVISESEPSHFYKKNIVVPAVRDFFNNERVYPLPIMYQEAIDGEGVSGSSGSLDVMLPEKR